MLFFSNLLILALSKDDTIKFACLWIDEAYSRFSAKESNNFLKFQSSCNYYSGDEKDRCNAIFESFLGVYISDTINIDKKLRQIPKETDFLFVMGQTSGLTYNFTNIQSKMTVYLASKKYTASSSFSMKYRIRKSINKMIHNMIKIQFDGSPTSITKLNQVNKIKFEIKNNYDINMSRTDIEVLRHHGLHIKGNGSKTSTIIGIVIGCVVAVIIIIVIICYCIKKKKEISNQNSSDQNDNKNNQTSDQQSIYYQPPQQPQQQIYYQQQPQYPQQQQNYYQQQPQYPPQQPYATPAGYPDQQYYQPYQSQPYGYPNQAYQGQPYANQTDQYQAIPIQPYENNNISESD